LPKPTDRASRRVAYRAQARSRGGSPIARVNRRSIALASTLQDSLHRSGGLAVAVAGAASRAARPFASTDRALPILVAAIVAVASLLAVLPTVSGGAVGKTSSASQDVRIAANGGFDRFANAYEARPDEVDGNVGPVDESFAPVVLPGDLTNQPGTEQSTADPGALLDDGTLVTGYAPDTSVADGADLITRYKVKAGDTLVTIARRFNVGMMTLWWANKLKSKDQLHVGQVLRIPPVSGLVVTVTDTDTLDSLAAQYNVDPQRIMDLNGLTDPTLVVGQVLVLPGAHGAPIPTPKPTPKPASHPSPQKSGGGSSSSSGSGGGTSSHHSGGGPSSYTGGKFHWPVVGGNNYISQYFHYGHEAIDIAATYGTPVVAAAAGHVQFAGWKSNGGGWQVWISHGSNLYTTYNHMSSLTVSTGQNVSRGQQVGRIGMTGDATGPHCHFEVWIGPIWNGGTRVNPLHYF
jgi:murein DD-endopeptidase MepM/ murein hydrolase activator NlpD